MKTTNSRRQQNEVLNSQGKQNEQRSLPRSSSRRSSSSSSTSSISSPIEPAWFNLDSTAQLCITAARISPRVSVGDACGNKCLLKRYLLYLQGHAKLTYVERHTVEIALRILEPILLESVDTNAATSPDFRTLAYALWTWRGYGLALPSSDSLTGTVNAPDRASVGGGYLRVCEDLSGAKTRSLAALLETLDFKKVDVSAARGRADPRGVGGRFAFPRVPVTSCSDNALMRLCATFLAWPRKGLRLVVDVECLVGAGVLRRTGTKAIDREVDVSFLALASGRMNSLLTAPIPTKEYNEESERALQELNEQVKESKEVDTVQRTDFTGAEYIQDISSISRLTNFNEVSEIASSIHSNDRQICGEGGSEDDGTSVNTDYGDCRIDDVMSTQTDCGEESNDSEIGGDDDIDDDDNTSRSSNSACSSDDTDSSHVSDCQNVAGGALNKTQFSSNATMPILSVSSKNISSNTLASSLPKMVPSAPMDDPPGEQRQKRQRGKSHWGCRNQCRSPTLLFWIKATDCPAPLNSSPDNHKEDQSLPSETGELYCSICRQQLVKKFGTNVGRCVTYMLWQKTSKALTDAIEYAELEEDGQTPNKKEEVPRKELLEQEREQVCMTTGVMGMDEGNMEVALEDNKRESKSEAEAGSSVNESQAKRDHLSQSPTKSSSISMSSSALLSTPISATLPVTPLPQSSQLTSQTNMARRQQTFLAEQKEELEELRDLLRDNDVPLKASNDDGNEESEDKKARGPAIRESYDRTAGDFEGEIPQVCGGQMCGCKNSSLTKRVERLNEKRQVVTSYCSIAQAALYHKIKKRILYSACQNGAEVDGCTFRYQTRIKKKSKVLSEQNSRSLRRLESSDIICRGEKCGCRSGKSKSTVLAFVRSNQIEANSSMAPLSSSLTSSSLTPSQNQSQELLGKYCTCTVAAESFGFDVRTIYDCVQGKQQDVDGICFRYESPSETPGFEGTDQEGGNGHHMDTQRCMKEPESVEELKAKLKAIERELAGVSEELAEEREKKEYLESMVHPLEGMRREMKGRLLDCSKEMLRCCETDVPRRQKRSAELPFYYSADSWTSLQAIPWHVEAKRVLYPAEAVQRLNEALKKERERAKEARAETSRVLAQLRDYEEKSSGVAPSNANAKRKRPL